MAKPVVHEITPSSIQVDSQGGFAFPSLNTAADKLVETCRIHGVAIASITKSHHCGVAGHTVERIAREGCIGMMFANTPKAMPTAGGKRALLGTNPIAFACPRLNANPLVIDLSMSTVSRGRILSAAHNRESVPLDWGKDRDGCETSDPNEILQGGTLSAFGGNKGAVLALMVEILSGSFTNSNFGYEASSFLDEQGGPPQTGQLIFCMQSNLFGNQFAERVEQILNEIGSEDGVRIPGMKRFESRQLAQTNGISYLKSLIQSVECFAD